MQEKFGTNEPIKYTFNGMTYDVNYMGNYEVLGDSNGLDMRNIIVEEIGNVITSLTVGVEELEYAAVDIGFQAVQNIENKYGVKVSIMIMAIRTNVADSSAYEEPKKIVEPVVQTIEQASQINEKPKYKFCPYCGTSSVGGNFCASCGAKYN